MNTSIFKAYDIRGKYPLEINEAAVFEIGRAIAGKWSRWQSRRGSATKSGQSANSHTHRQAGKAQVVVGYDARLSSPALQKALIKGLNHSYVLKNLRMKIIDVGVITTPMLYFLVNKLKAAGGIMITASHNPKEYNGLKVVGPKAEPISGKEIYELYKKLR